MTREEFLEKNGFNEAGITYTVVGEDTYAIKDWLKEQGCKYSPILKWHISQIFKLPDGFQWVMFNFNDIMEWSEAEENALYIENAETKVQAVINRTLPPSKSEYIGAIGERLRNLTAVLKSRRSFNSTFGLTYIYTFQRCDDILVWFTQKELEISDGTTVDLTGTIKSHEDFRGIRTTKLNRCIIKEIG